MSDQSKIEWTDATWNPVRGCSMVSKGCERCYAMRVAHRFAGTGMPYEGLTRATSDGPKWTGQVRPIPELLEAPLHWKKPRRVFVNSMSDLFHPDVPFEFIDRVFAIMMLTHHHTFQILTKRPDRMEQYVTQHLKERRGGFWFETIGYLSHVAEQTGIASPDEVHRRFEEWRKLNRPQLPDKPETIGATIQYKPRFPLPNVWLGVSCEDQKTADERIPHLLATPAAVRWISAEPLLGAIELCRIDDKTDGWRLINALHGTFWADPFGGTETLGTKLDWVVTGGESGPGSRPMHPAWARSLRDQCAAAGVPYFFKQWGDWMPKPDWNARGGGAFRTVHVRPDRPQEPSINVGKKAAGRLLDGREWNEYPEARS